MPRMDPTVDNLTYHGRYNNKQWDISQWDMLAKIGWNIIGNQYFNPPKSKYLVVSLRIIIFLSNSFLIFIVLITDHSLSEYWLQCHCKISILYFIKMKMESWFWMCRFINRSSFVNFETQKSFRNFTFQKINKPKESVLRGVCFFTIH